MSILEKIEAQLNADLDLANATTSKSDTTVHDAIASLIDGYGGGSSKELIANWDFTKTENKLIDSVNGYAAVISDISDTEDGLYFNNQFSTIALPLYFKTNCIYEVDFGDCSSASKQGSDHGRLFMTNSYDEGFIYRGYGYDTWEWYTGNWSSNSLLKDIKSISNKTLTITCDDNDVRQNVLLTAHLDDKEIVSLERDREYLVPNKVSIGANRSSIMYITVKAIRVYKI